MLLLQSNLHAAKINQKVLKQQACKAREQMAELNTLQQPNNFKQLILGGRDKQVDQKVQEARSNKIREKQVALVCLEYQVIMRL